VEFSIKALSPETAQVGCVVLGVHQGGELTPAARRVERAGLAPELQEDLLQDVFGRAGVADHAQRDGVHQRSVAVVERGHGGLVPGAQARHQGDVLCLHLWVGACHAGFLSKYAGGPPPDVANGKP